MKRHVLLLIVALGACVNNAPPRPRPAIEPELGLTAVNADVVRPGTHLELRGKGFVPPEAGTPTVSFGGLATLPATFVDERRLEVEVSEEILDALGGDGARFEDDLTLTYEYASGAEPQSVTLAVAFDLRRSLTPRLDGTMPDVVFLGSKLVLRGDGFLAPSEGGSRALLIGSFTPQQGNARAVEADLLMALVSRIEATVEIAPDVFGIAPGKFDGTVVLRNAPLTAPPQDSGAPRALSLLLGPTAILEATPAVRRGQRLLLRGRGFIPKSAEAGQATIVRLDGDFTERGGRLVRWRDADAVELVPEYVSGSELSYVLRASQLPNGDLTGLGLVAGTFEGRLTPVLFRGADEEVGVPLTVRLEIRPQRQVIFLKYLPGFTDTLRSFGLRNVELEIRRRIFEICLRDYERWNVEFRETRPMDYVEYGVVEIGGPDPNAQGLFGLDNTTGKDLGNLRLNDVIGGFNAETEENGFLAFGGVFLESFLALSPRAREPLPIAHPYFDAVFDPFRPDRGGRPAEPGEYAEGPRQPQIAEAIRVLGNLIGTTVTHEIGHTLGMAIADGFFHNPIPGPNQIMDSGDERPFEERAEVDGQGPGAFEPEHAEYLDGILPRDQ